MLPWKRAFCGESEVLVPWLAWEHFLEDVLGLKKLDGMVWLFHDIVLKICRPSQFSHTVCERDGCGWWVWHATIQSEGKLTSGQPVPFIQMKQIDTISITLHKLFASANHSKSWRPGPWQLGIPSFICLRNVCLLPTLCLNAAYVKNQM